MCKSSLAYFPLKYKKKMYGEVNTYVYCQIIFSVLNNNNNKNIMPTGAKTYFSSASNIHK